VVTTTGELQAESSVEITAPSELRTSRHLRFGEIKIQDLVPEGTMVDSGDYVGLLDRSEVSNSLKSAQDQLEEEEANYRRVKMDTALTLSNLRDELINLQFNVEEAEITLEQSKFEPPATIRQAQINLEKPKGLTNRRCRITSSGWNRPKPICAKRKSTWSRAGRM